ncbi:CoA-dependent acyltransferase [Aureobasidium pullulans]|uniref:Dihydrolipoamide acetyltransferase component of pyruvate dehydrogenase complex n=1 Tax=Aureobasidium pullulans TaxID=5580 RepID=A0A4S8WQM6_AURPU|nr:CoA-dependent acyltransferase [Aureobasidium pullulans]THW65486.1 CoA-dependent acyltransferase [Aureobasidium pullulans]
MYLALCRFAIFSITRPITSSFEMAASCSTRLFWRQQPRFINHRLFHTTRRRDVVKPFLLADIGEGTRECQIIQWFVQPGARVEQFDKLCEVQSDKTASDITSPFDGVIKKLYYEADDMALVGKVTSQVPQKEAPQHQTPQQEPQSAEREEVQGPLGKIRHHDKGLATPAVRHLIKELNVKVEDIDGSGKDGRVLKEDVHRHVSQDSQKPVQQEIAKDQKKPLTPVQTAMFKTMTRSLTIPHFLYSSTVDTGSLNRFRVKINSTREAGNKLSPLPFILKAISMAMGRHPLLNAWLDTSDPKKPELSYKASHDFGIAVDTSSGLLVPVVRNVESQSVASIAEQIKVVSSKAREGKLGPKDLQGPTFSVSNIGSIGGGVVAPIIVEPQVAIVGVGRAKVVPGFDEQGNVVKKEEMVLSWSADHRVVDGAECARCAERVNWYLQNMEAWVLEMK